ncbi:kinase [uncultured Paraglaciecola sp.]|uniref:kinase n=1 Tax=uncultured Paraglaciecola sp. TaxID=1765024 RepID=UPI0030DB7450|tara:strand:- start:17631 stop:18512 length:882 start_codon:yes stop_codon:yes gene_type:complete
MISTFINKNKLSEDFIKIAEGYYIPLAEEIKTHQLGAKSTYFVGINGSQGSGKSTLSEFLKEYLTETYALNVVVMSLDDFYFSRIERQIIADDVHPLFATRGVPGTHNMSLAKSVLDELKEQQPTTIPRFNKATDDPHPFSAWTKVTTAVDVVIFEGWCWGVEPQTYQQLKQPVNTFEATEDPNSDWRNHANLQLSLYYQPLYSLMNKWVMLKAPSFADVFAWRLEQEQKLSAATNGQEKSGIMNEQQILRFIQHYQRLTEHGLSTLPKKCDHVFELNSVRAIIDHKTKDIHA